MTTSIAFIIGNALRVVELTSDVKELAVLMKEKNGYLNLSERFEGVFRSLPKVDKYHLLIRPEAGFTDTRVTYLWLKGEMWGRAAVLQIFKVNDTNLETYEDFAKIFNNQKPEKDLVYSREPSIG